MGIGSIYKTYALIHIYIQSHTPSVCPLDHPPLVHHPGPVYDPPDRARHEDDHHHPRQDPEQDYPGTSSLVSVCVRVSVKDPFAEDSKPPEPAEREGEEEDGDKLDDANEDVERVTTAHVKPVSSKTPKEETEKKAESIEFPFSAQACP